MERRYASCAFRRILQHCVVLCTWNVHTCIQIVYIRWYMYVPTKKLRPTTTNAKLCGSLSELLLVTIRTNIYSACWLSAAKFHKHQTTKTVSYDWFSAVSAMLLVTGALWWWLLLVLGWNVMFSGLSGIVNGMCLIPISSAWCSSRKFCKIWNRKKDMLVFCCWHSRLIVKTDEKQAGRIPSRKNTRIPLWFQF